MSAMTPGTRSASCGQQHSPGHLYLQLRIRTGWAGTPQHQGSAQPGRKHSVTVPTWSPAPGRTLGLPGPSVATSRKDRLFPKVSGRVLTHRKAPEFGKINPLPESHSIHQHLHGPEKSCRTRLSKFCVTLVVPTQGVPTRAEKGPFSSQPIAPHPREHGRGGPQFSHSSAAS